MSKAASVPTSWVPSVGLASLGILFAALCTGLVPYFSRGLTEQGMAPHAVAFYRFAAAAFVLFPVLYVHRGHWRTIAWGLVAGAVMGLGWVGYAHALTTAPVSTVGVLYMTYPVFTLIIAWALFGDHPSRRAIVAAGLIVVAAVLASSPAAVSVEQLPVLAIALAAPFGFGFGISVLVHRLSRSPPLVRLASVSLGCVVGLAPLLVSSTAIEVLPQSTNDWIMVLGIGLATAFIPQLVYTVCAPIVGSARTAILGSVELPMMFVVGLVLLGERVGFAQAAACAIVVGAIVFSGSRVTKNVATNIARK